MPTSPAVALLVPDGEQPPAPAPALPGLDATVLRPGEAPAGRFDLALAVGTRGTALLDGVDAARRALWLVDMDDRRHPPGSAAARAALDTYTLPIPVVAAANWMADQLAILRPADAPPVVVVTPGREGPVADAVPVHDGPLRVAAADDDARAAVAAMREPAVAVAADDAPDVWAGLPRVAGFPRAPLQAFAAGATAVLTPVTGAEEYVVDGENALYTAWDDERGTSRLLDLLARDRDLLTGLRERALATARAWPDASEAARRLAAALTKMVH
jgi:glycosyltransferase involved in cell wall biosynthesis